MVRRRECGHSSGGWSWRVSEGSLSEARLSERLPRPQPPGAISLSWGGGWDVPAAVGWAAQGARERVISVRSRYARAWGHSYGRGGTFRGPAAPRSESAELPLPPLPGTGFGVRHFPVSFPRCDFAFNTLGLLVWFHFYNCVDVLSDFLSFGEVFMSFRGGYSVFSLDLKESCAPR